MKIGLNFFPVRPQFLLPVARRADELGYDSLWIGEHLVFPTTIMSTYPYGSSLGAPLPTTPLFDPLITFAYVAAQTRQIQLGTSVYLVNLRHPVIVAKLVATLDALAGGRIILGIGSGWLKEEYDTVNASWDHRGARMEECIEIMRRLWTEERVTHSGRFYHFEEVGFEPKPARVPVPILIGGDTTAALKRAARSGDGWFGLRYAPESAAAQIRELRAMRATISHLKLPSVPRQYRTSTIFAAFATPGPTASFSLPRNSRAAKKTLRPPLMASTASPRRS